MAFPGVVELGDSDAAVALPTGLPTPTNKVSRDAGGERLHGRATGGAGLSESKTSVDLPNIYRLPTKPSISMYIASLNSKDIFLVFDNSFFSSLVIPHQFAEPLASM